VRGNPLLSVPEALVVVICIWIYRLLFAKTPSFATCKWDSIQCQDKTSAFELLLEQSPADLVTLAALKLGFA
jgi:hypothetical protein